MPPKRKASVLSTPATKSKSSPSKSTASKATKPKGAKKDASPGQANTLFDFYPNLSKNAPLFRAPMVGDEPNDALSAQDTKLDYNLATTDVPEIAVEPVVETLHVQAEDNVENSAFGPFSLVDDDDDGEFIAPVSAQHAALSDSAPSMPSMSETAKSSETSINDDLEDEFNHGEEIEIKEERDRFENGDDEENEDEAWSWQEYNAENFSRDESVLCPMCGKSIISFSEHDRSAHVNRCLDLPPPSEDENQVHGKPLVDDTVLREIKREDSDIVIKRENSEVKIKKEPSELSIKMEDVIPESPSYSVKSEPLEQVKLESVKSEHVKTEDVKPTMARGASNAFDKIMVNHSEEKQWADAARTENLQRGTKYKTRICPFYKILSPFPIAVDAFKYGTVPGMEGYYLTHFHSDHYGGLSSTWDAGPIYCSSITGSLVVQQLKVRPEYVVKLPMSEPVNINGVTVTLIDANHCPGSTLFLFEGTVRGRSLRYLHCGDFRAEPAQLLHPAVRGKRIDSIYLDTTYLSPKYAFPSQDDVIEACAHVCRDLAGLLTSSDSATNPVAEARNASGLSKFLTPSLQKDASNASAAHVKRKGRLLVVVGTYSIGKERIVLGIAKSINSKIYAASRKRDILSCLDDADLMSRLTDDPADAQVHMTYLQEIRAETLLEYMNSLAPHFDRVVGFRGTGWTYAPPKTRFLDSPSIEQIMRWQPRYSFRMMTPGRGSSAIAACYGVPYSEHSSFRELMCFCLSTAWGRIIPTVNVGSENSRKKMKFWIDKWAIEVRKNGIRQIKDGSKEWM